MSPGSIPRYDLYEELEVSRSASVEVIEAAYKTLVKGHHPDVSKPDDAERIKRLNVARDWLISPTRRRRYDDANGIEGERRAAIRKPSRSRSREVAPDAPRARTSSPESFGPNSGEVRQFLARVRELNGARARELIDGRDSLEPGAYARSRSAALVASRGGRHNEWTFAREAATVIVNGKLSGSPLTSPVAAIVADIAGAIVVRDLLDPGDFERLLAPWTWRERPAVPAGAPVGRPIDPSPYAAAAVAAVREIVVRGRRNPAAVAAAATVLVVALGIAMLTRGPSRPESAIAGFTSRPSSVVVADPLASAPGVGPIPMSSGASAPPTSGSEPSATPPGDRGPGATPVPLATPQGPPTPRPTPRPTAVPTPSPTPTPTPPPTPSPTPAPTPTPAVVCEVVSLIGLNTSNAQLTWSSAGFTGTVQFSPPVPPQYKIGWQSLTVGDSVLCTSNISVQQAPP